MRATNAPLFFSEMALMLSMIVGLGGSGFVTKYC